VVASIGVDDVACTCFCSEPPRKVLGKLRVAMTVDVFPSCSCGEYQFIGSYTHRRAISLLVIPDSEVKLATELCDALEYWECNPEFRSGKFGKRVKEEIVNGTAQRCDYLHCEEDGDAGEQGLPGEQVEARD